MGCCTGGHFYVGALANATQPHVDHDVALLSGRDLRTERAPAGFGGVVWALFNWVRLPPLKTGARFRPADLFHDPKVSRVLTLMALAALGVAITQLNVVLDRIIALDW